MSDNDPTQPIPEKQIGFETVVPVFAIRDLDLATNWYETKLGFRQDWAWSEPPITSVSRGAVQIMLKQVENPSASEVYVEMEHVDAFHDVVAGSGQEIVVAIADRPYGMRDFRVDDPDGNILVFGEAIPEPGDVA